MSFVVQLSLAVGEPAVRDPGPAVVSLAAAADIAAVAGATGVAAIRLAGTGRGALDPTVAGAYLAGLHDGLGYVVEIPTTHHAPYNVARRVLSLDRATGGRTGLALRAGDGDEVSGATAPDPTAVDPARRWTEYARVVTRLWESFPRAALIGDQRAGIVVDDTLIRPIDHDGVFYRVAGPLDGPSSVQGRPVVVADLGVLGPAAVAVSADVVVTGRAAAGSAGVVVAGRDRAAGVDAALSAALRDVGRSRRDVALLGRVEVAPGDLADPDALAADLRTWAGEHELDGLELVPSGDAGAVTTALRGLVPRLVDTGRASARTLRAAYGLREIAAVAA